MAFTERYVTAATSGGLMIRFYLMPNPVVLIRPALVVVTNNGRFVMDTNRRETREFDRDDSFIETHAVEVGPLGALNELAGWEGGVCILKWLLCEHRLHVGSHCSMSSEVRELWVKAETGQLHDEQALTARFDDPPLGYESVDVGHHILHVSRN